MEETPTNFDLSPLEEANLTISDFLDGVKWQPTAGNHGVELRTRVVLLGTGKTVEVTQLRNAIDQRVFGSYVSVGDRDNGVYVNTPPPSVDSGNPDYESESDEIIRAAESLKKAMDEA